MQRKCDRCGDAFTDNVTSNEHSRGEAWQEAEVDDVPTLCSRCDQIARDGVTQSR
jgi:hypothetical protein